MDEYQDTNNLQESISELLLKNGNLFCVGDDWQAIYSFRGSNVNHFLSFRKKFRGARIFRLEQNYRSADEIVQLETFEKCFPLKAGFKFKEGEDFNRRNILNISRIALKASLRAKI